MVLRVPVLYGEVEQNKESALNVLLDAVWNVEKRERIEMDDWSIRYPTWVLPVNCVLAVVLSTRTIYLLNLVRNTSDVARVLKDIAGRLR